MIWLTVALVALWILTLFMGFVLFGALRTVSVVLWRLDNISAIAPSRMGRAGLKIGKRAPDFTLADLNEEPISLSDFLGKKLLLVFMQTGCGPCNGLVGELNQFQEKHRVCLLVIQRGNREEVRKWTEDKRVRFPVVLQEKYELSRKYEMFATPYAFLINERGMIVSKGIINDAKQIEFVISRGPVVAAADQEEKESPDSEEVVASAAESKIS